MARDGSGTYTRVSNSFTVPITGTPISPTHADAFWDELETEMTDSLSRSGKGGMSADLDMNNNDINEIKTAVFQGSTSGNTTMIATAIAGTTTLTLPAATDTLVGKATTDTLTNKTLTSPAITTPTGIVKGDVGLGNVDNTSDANKPVSTATQTALDAKAAGSASSTDNAAARYDSTTGKVLQNSAVIIADTTGALSRSGGGGIPIEAASTNTIPSVGFVGRKEEIEVTYASKFSISTATVTNVTSRTFAAGNWLIFGNVGFETAGGGIQNEIHCSTGATSATLDTAPAGGSTHGYHVTYLANQGQVPIVGARYFSLASDTTIYLHAYTSFSVGTCTVYGFLFGVKQP